MSKETLVFIFGLLVLLVPYLGIPRSFKEVILGCTGVLLMFIGYSLRRRAFLHGIQHSDGERRADMFVENMGNTHSSSSESGKNTAEI